MRTLFTLGFSIFMASTATRAASPLAKVDARHVALLKANCYPCHGTETQEAGVRLDNLPHTIATLVDADRWQKVLNALNSGEMPPKDEPRPDPQAKLELLAHLSEQMAVARKALADRGGGSRFGASPAGNTPTRSKICSGSFPTSPTCPRTARPVPSTRSGQISLCLRSRSNSIWPPAAGRSTITSYCARTIRAPQ